MANVPSGVETLPKISIIWVGRTNVTDRQTTDRQTDGRTTSEHERAFTFAKKDEFFETQCITNWHPISYSFEVIGDYCSIFDEKRSLVTIHAFDRQTDRHFAHG